MKTYKIKPEYLDRWGEDATDDTVITEEQVEHFAREWGMKAWELQDQLIPEDGEYRFWFAAQRDREDDWGTGSYNLDEAKKMAGSFSAELVAVIDESGDAVCVDEIMMTEE